MGPERKDLEIKTCFGLAGRGRDSNEKEGKRDKKFGVTVIGKN